jgi:hypothetical protein
MLGKGQGFFPLRAIGKLRKDARDEIERLIRFLDETDDHMMASTHPAIRNTSA